MMKSRQVSAHDKNLVNMRDTQSSPSVRGGGTRVVDEHTEMEREQQEENLPDSAQT